MPGFVFHSSAIMTCTHGSGVATVMPKPPRVLIDNRPVATVSSQFTIAGCAFTTPCTTLQWANVSARVVADGGFVLLQAPAPAGSGNALGAPTPAPTIVQAMQMRVTAS
jgi:hypothetical protein